MKVGVLTVSDRASTGEYADESGPLIAKIISGRLGWEVAETQLVPDEQDQIADVLRSWSDDDHLNLVLTTGGTGFAPRDITPEATLSVIDRQAPGLAEAMRSASLAVTPHAMLSRAVCGMRGRTLIVNLPGSIKAVKENLEVLLPVLPHAVELLSESPDARSGHNPPTPV